MFRSIEKDSYGLYKKQARYFFREGSTQQSIQVGADKKAWLIICRQNEPKVVTHLEIETFHTHKGHWKRIIIEENTKLYRDQNLVKNWIEDLRIS